MVTKRTPLRRDVRARISPRVIELWRLCTEIQDAGNDDAWEEDGGRQREFLDASRELGSLLGLRPWQANPLHVDDGAGPRDGTAFAASWPAAQELRRQIIAALAEADASRTD